MDQILKRARAICSLHCFTTLHSCDMRMHSFLANQKPIIFSCTLSLLLLLLSLARMMASIGSSCSPTVYTKFITKSDSLFVFFFTKWSLHRATTFLLQSACREATTSITKWDDYCKVPQNKSAFLFHVDVDTATKDKKKTCLQRQCLQMKASTDQEDIII